MGMAKNQLLITPEGKIRKLPNGQYQIDKCSGLFSQWMSKTNRLDNPRHPRGEAER
jgi:hypothetical protein